MKLAFIGTGYVGLVSGSCLADVGHSVDCFDINQEKIDLLNQGHIPIYEPGLDQIVSNSIDNGNLKFSNFEEIDVNIYDAIFICVDTPNDNRGYSDLSNLNSVLGYLGDHLKTNMTIFIKSTVPVGTCSSSQEIINKSILMNELEIRVDVASNPEFLKEGDAVNDFKKPDRIIIGTDSEETKNLSKSIYAPYNHISNKIIFMSKESSEMTKYAANALLATKISFMNDLSRMADASGANIDSLRVGIGSDERIGRHFLYAGLGYGGSCFPKDTVSLLSQAEDFGVNLNVVSAVIKSNKAQIQYFAAKILKYFDKNNLEKKITIWGLTFKPKTDDIRESKGIEIAEYLLANGFEVKSYDPMHEKLNQNPDLLKMNICDDKIKSLNGSKAFILATEWTEFWHCDYKEIKGLGLKAVFDGRNVLNRDEIEHEGLDYFSVGRN